MSTIFDQGVNITNNFYRNTRRDLMHIFIFILLFSCSTITYAFDQDANSSLISTQNNTEVIQDEKYSLADELEKQRQEEQQTEFIKDQEYLVDAQEREQAEIKRGGILGGLTGAGDKLGGL